MFVPNRLYFFETHGIYWRGQYHFGNKPFVNLLPNRLRDRLAPHVRATRAGRSGAFRRPTCEDRDPHADLSGYDNIVARSPLRRTLQAATYALERTPLRRLGLSHFLVLKVTA